ncbi:hypothetical protein BGZ61DRAFT_458728 [Ilyonectria robusta]|uniref:uncharacterized protein n=1 Tax=Ilyonectria robusta TaxID=1079257 RepID=UPI001E8EEF22|nr:uncharacterized protein BGZ61DRAFT_458728 [Ilyonectria robusta]KAH8673049.1 hypothetical protein BGZ61DRAFT_458728 [Ilyonectria robusta]
MARRRVKHAAKVNRRPSVAESGAHGADVAIRHGCFDTEFPKQAISTTKLSATTQSVKTPQAVGRQHSFASWRPRTTLSDGQGPETRLCGPAPTPSPLHPHVRRRSTNLATETRVPPGMSVSRQLCIFPARNMLVAGVNDWSRKPSPEQLSSV